MNPGLVRMKEVTFLPRLSRWVCCTSVSVVGGNPYVIYDKNNDWIKKENVQKWDTYQGTEFQVIDLYAKKFGFIPKYMRAASWDGKGSVIEMVRKS